MKNKIQIIFFSVSLISSIILFVFLHDKKASDEEIPGFDSPGKYAQYFHDITTPLDQLSSGYEVNYKLNELYKAKRSLVRVKKTLSVYPWVQRGPGNVSGRTRSLLVDPDDAAKKTWYAGSASGGIWKTTDGGISWRDLSPDFPNLSTTALAMAPSNHNIIYAGTGEGYGGVGMVAGNGIFKSVNKGESWVQLASTVQNEDFIYVNVIVVDPENEEILIAGTNSGIFKSVNGGTDWTKTYEEGFWVQDIVTNPRDFNIQYAAAHDLGILKSTDAGESWNRSLKGMGEGGRFHLAISPLNPNKIFTSVEGWDSQTGGLQTHVYVTNDAAQNWSKFVSPTNFLGNQGWFNNIIEVHPFNDNIVFIAGVDFGKIEFKSGTSSSDPQVLRVDTFNTSGFMQFINFGGTFLGGGMSTGDLEDGEELISSDWSSVEIRFGNGLKQKAHRFTVPVGQGAGVLPEDYTYMDYVDVPFQAWDMDNNRQLAISFRDQERDGKFNLIERIEDDDISGREYFYIHAVDYNTSQPSDKIAVAGGHTYKQLYFFWPILTPDSTWNENTIPEARINIEYGTFSLINSESTVTTLADYRKNNNLHVDHHEIIPIVTDPVNKTFTILEANDGGLGISYNEGKSWEQIKSGYITTQFYGVAKKPGAQEYIGGMQDNGTWQSPLNEEASSISVYEDKIGGDGFEVLWHPIYNKRLVGSSYNNRIYSSSDGGETWIRATQGINSDDGPFVTRLANSHKNPDIIFAVGRNGVYRHKNFALGRFGWETIAIEDGWTIGNSVLSSHNVRVSLANDSVVWAGAGMYPNPDLHMFVSKNGGNTFDSVLNYKDVRLGLTSGIATHPTDKNTAYLLFSFNDKPKILRTTDLGKTWEDISGFGKNKESNNGFPDVMVQCLLVLNSTTLWAGTEIGVFESTDNGISWHYANNGLPAVSIWQMFIQDNEIIVATHGRGLWSLNMELVDVPDFRTENVGVHVYPNPNAGAFKLNLTNEYTGDLKVEVFNSSGKIVYAGNFNKNGSSFEEEINMEGVQPGVYVISVIQKNKKATATFIIKK